MTLLYLQHGVAATRGLSAHLRRLARIVDPESKTVEVLALSRGQYERHGLFRGNSVLSSRLLPGLTFPVADIFPDGA